MPTVLLVDDSSVVRLAVAKRLEGEGLAVRAVASVNEARGVDVATCDCAIIDVDLDDGSGTDLAAELRAKHPKLPVAFFTSSTPTDMAAVSRAQGPVFAKPDVGPVVAWARDATRRQPPPTK